MNLLSTARFFTTVAQLRQLPQAGMPEVAFVGRSNAGKSSAINVLCQRRRLAFASRTPGRTQALNYFSVGPGEETVGYLVDTPGYGYASAPLEIKKGWDQLGGRYLQGRESLCGVVLIVDIRREMTDRDRALVQWIAADVPLLAVASKCDKLNRADRTKACRNIATQISELRPADTYGVMGFSAQDLIGVEEVRERIQLWLTPQDHSVELPMGDGEPAVTPVSDKLRDTGSAPGQSRGPRSAESKPDDSLPALASPPPDDATI